MFEESSYHHRGAAGRGLCFGEAGEAVATHNNPFATGSRRRKRTEQIHVYLFEGLCGRLYGLQRSCRSCRWRFSALAFLASSHVLGDVGAVA